MFETGILVLKALEAVYLTVESAYEKVSETDEKAEQEDPAWEDSHS